MLHPTYIAVLCQLFADLKESQVNWVVTGSLSFALQDLLLDPHDSDIQKRLEDGTWEAPVDLRSHR